MKQKALNFLGGKLWLRLLVLQLSIILLCSCGSGKNAADRINGYDELQELVSSGEFEIENQWAYPLSGNMVDLIGNTNFIRFKNDSVDLFLPYFGVRHAGGNYGGRDGGIKYKGVAEELEITEAEDDSRIMLEFEAEEGSENYDFRITLYANGNAATSVTSSERNAISYRGTVKKLSKESEFD